MAAILLIPLIFSFFILSVILNEINHAANSSNQARFQREKEAALERIYLAENALLQSGIADINYLSNLESAYQDALIAYDRIVPSSISFKNGKYKWKSNKRKLEYTYYKINREGSV